MSYYATNAVYKLLEAHRNEQFIWASGTAWILLYADNTAHVRAVAFVSGHSMGSTDSQIVDRLKAAETTANLLAEIAQLPFAVIQFDNRAASIDRVELNGNSIELSALRDWFSKVGLPVNAGATQKPINSAESSAYHNWQRNNLGSIKVSDVDLIRIDAGAKSVAELVELKRSFDPLEKWKPYPQDFDNFNVVANLANRIGAKFTIAYNQRVSKTEIGDDASRLSLFSYSKSNGPQILGVVTFDQFVKGAYLS